MPEGAAPRYLGDNAACSRGDCPAVSHNKWQVRLALTVALMSCSDDATVTVIP